MKLHVITEWMPGCPKSMHGYASLTIRSWKPLACSHLLLKTRAVISRMVWLSLNRIFLLLSGRHVL